jgi:hypothetical protein
MKVTADPIVRIRVELEPGEMVIPASDHYWSITELVVVVQMNHRTDNIRAHLDYPDHAFALREIGLYTQRWSKRAMWPGFIPRPEDIPAEVLHEITVAYAYRCGLPVGLPPFDVVNGVGE